MSLLVTSGFGGWFCINTLKVPIRSISTSKVTYLYSQSSLGIDKYLHGRKKIKEQFSNFSDKFRTKMIEFCNDPKSLIFTEDLKNMVHLAEPSDLELVVKMVNKFNTSTAEFRFGSFIFGPVIMRMFYFLDAPTEALQCFQDPKNDGFFDQLSTYHILLDLLYNHEMYDEMKEVFKKVMERQINMLKFPKYPLVLILAACYKQNSSQSFEYASKIWSEMTSVGTVPLRRASSFFAALALNQSRPDVALESMSSQRSQYVTIRNIKVMALADMGRVDDALPILRSVLDIDIPEENKKHTFFEETITKVKQALDKHNNADIKKEYECIETELRNRNLIDSQTLDQHLCSEITMTNTPSALRGMPSQVKRFPYGLRKKSNM
ncbi:hypothetical protein ACJJTC_003110 [Scirpophaga incertulas]